MLQNYPVYFYQMNLHCLTHRSKTQRKKENLNTQTKIKNKNNCQIKNVICTNVILNL